MIRRRNFGLPDDLRFMDVIISKRINQMHKHDVMTVKIFSLSIGQTFPYLFLNINPSLSTSTDSDFKRIYFSSHAQTFSNGVVLVRVRNEAFLFMACRFRNMVKFFLGINLSCTYKFEWCIPKFRDGVPNEHASYKSFRAPSGVPASWI